MQLTPYVPEKTLAINKKYSFGYKNGCLVLRNVVSNNIIYKLRIHSRWKSLTLVERLIRLEPRAAISLDDNTFLYSDHGAIYQYDVETNTIKVIHSFKRGMNNPLTFCVRKDENGSVIEVIYGEYIWNTDKGPVSIYKYNLKEWKEVYSFPAKTIVHIHNVLYDRFKNCYVIVTGDEDSESAIWKADLDFKRVERIAGGSQKYRACVGYSTERGIYYATDTPLEQNWLYLLDKENRLHEIYKMPGPCIYGKVYDGWLYMATSVEGDPTLGGWKYRLSNKLGKGVRDRKVHIIRCNQEGDVEEVAKLRKDALPMWLFQFGNAQFPDAEDGIYISTQSTVEKGTYKLLED